MAKNIPWPRVCAIQLRTQHGSQITDTDLHCIRRRSFRLAAYVYRGPAEDQCNGGVYADSSKESSDVGNARPCLGVGVREKNDVADDCNGGGCEDEECATGIALGKYSPEYCKDGCDCIRRNREELGLS